MHIKSPHSLLDDAERTRINSLICANLPVFSMFTKITGHDIVSIIKENQRAKSQIIFVGLEITGDLNFEGLTICRPIWFQHCRIHGKIVLRDANIKTFGISHFTCDEDTPQQIVDDAIDHLFNTTIYEAFINVLEDKSYSDIIFKLLAEKPETLRAAKKYSSQPWDAYIDALYLSERLKHARTVQVEKERAALRYHMNRVITNTSAKNFLRICCDVACIMAIKFCVHLGRRYVMFMAFLLSYLSLLCFYSTTLDMSAYDHKILLFSLERLFPIFPSIGVSKGLSLPSDRIFTAMNYSMQLFCWLLNWIAAFNIAQMLKRRFDRGR